MTGERWYLTTPIYYVNDVPHLGHAYTTVAADAMARWRRLRGAEVLFLTGTDEHGLKVQRSAEALGITPKELADRVMPRFRDLWPALDISNDDFIRTTEERHVSVVQQVFQKLYDRGDIYLGEYEDWYCTPDESYFTETQLVDGRCPDCGRPVERVREASYFFRMSRYQEQLLEHIRANPDFIMPRSRRNEIVSFVEGGLRDLSVSRTTFSWGIPVPFDPKHVIYVWVDALTNYVTAAGLFSDDERFARFWPADLHLIGKDILRFHAVYWPAMLMALDLPLPRRVFAHGWWTVEGQKMSKSLGNVLDPWALASEYGVDQLRYFLLREIPFGQDGDFSRKAMVGRINSDLANDLGNLVSRTLAMAAKYHGGKVPRTAGAGDLAPAAAAAWEGVSRAMDETAFHQALAAAWDFFGAVNRFIDAEKPWELAKRGDPRLDEVMAQLLESLRTAALLVFPFMPGAGRKIWAALGEAGPLDSRSFPDGPGWPGLQAGRQTAITPAIFPRLETA